MDNISEFNNNGSNNNEVYHWNILFHLKSGKKVCAYVSEPELNDSSKVVEKYLTDRRGYLGFLDDTFTRNIFVNTNEIEYFEIYSTNRKRY